MNSYDLLLLSTRLSNVVFGLGVQRTWIPWEIILASRTRKSGAHEFFLVPGMDLYELPRRPRFRRRLFCCRPVFSVSNMPVDISLTEGNIATFVDWNRQLPSFALLSHSCMSFLMVQAAAGNNLVRGQCVQYELRRESNCHSHQV